MSADWLAKGIDVPFSTAFVPHTAVLLVVCCRFARLVCDSGNEMKWKHSACFFFPASQKRLRPRSRSVRSTPLSPTASLKKPNWTAATLKCSVRRLEQSFTGNSAHDLQSVGPLYAAGEQPVGLTHKFILSTAELPNNSARSWQPFRSWNFKVDVLGWQNKASSYLLSVSFLFIVYFKRL